MTESLPAQVVEDFHRRLVVHPAWEAVANTDQLLELALAVQRIPAPTFEEEERASFVHDQMLTLGLDQVHTDPLHNVYGRLPGRHAGPGVLITAHTDTVFARDVNLEVRRDGQRIYGPGLGDNSISVAAILHLAGVMQEQHIVPECPLWFVANTGEEGLGNLRGMRAVVDRLHDQITTVLVVDAQFGTVVHAGVASRRYRVSVEAPGGHAWQDFGEPSAVHVLVRLAARLTELDVPVEPKTSINLGVVDGGTTINAIAQHASLLLDLRSVDETCLAALAAQVEAVVAAAAAQEPGVTVRIEVVGERPGGTIELGDPLVQLASAAYTTVGAHVQYDAASTDANVPLSRGIPAVCIGICRSQNAHRLDEYLETEAIPAGMRALLLLTLAAATRTPTPPTYASPDEEEQA